jgi:penicillin-binding protein 2
MRLFRKKDYSITPERDEWVAPEDTLIDSSSTLSTVERPVSDNIFRSFTVSMVVLSVVLVGAVGRLAVIRYDLMSQLGLRNRTINVSVPPPRGIIMDRNGTPLVRNVPSFDLLVIARQVRRNADGTFPDIAGVASALGRDSNELTLTLNDIMAKESVFFLATDLTREQVLTLRNILPSGFNVITSTKRDYLFGEQFSHVIGYVGKVSKQDMTNDSYYLPSDTIGRLGIESSYEDVLRGVHGRLVFGSNNAISVEAPTSGANLALNIDSDVQKALYGSLSEILRQSGLGEAAAVVQDPSNGAILGLVSFPSYDNNVFNGMLSQEDFDKLFNNKRRPLFDRVIAGQYNPGSTIKPFIGMTALQENIVTSTQVVNTDCVSLTVPNPNVPDEPYVFKNWRADYGPFTLRRAIADSCNIYFFTVGGGFGNLKGLGVTRIMDYLRRGLADHILGIDLPGEDHGFLPTPDWKYETKKEPWYQGDTYNVSIGQGDLVVTPLWINAYVSAIANGGTIWQPEIASRVVDDQRNTLTAMPAHQLGTLPFSADVIAEMKAAMRKTVTDGTGKLLADLPVPVAAKTGTAEVIKGQRINSLLTVFAPADNPKIALTLLIEGSASNQGYALRAAKQFLSWYFSPNRNAAVPPVVPTASLAPSASVSAISPSVSP